MGKRLTAFLLAASIMFSLVPQIRTSAAVDSIDPDNLSTITYDFNLKDNPEITYGNGVSFAGKSLNNDIIAGLAANYETLGWKFHSKVAGETGNFTSFMFAGDSHTWDGIRINSKHKDSGAALTIQSPGAGTYTLALAHKTHKWGAAVGNVYILPGDTTDVAQALKTAEPLKTVNYFEDKVDPHKTANTILGTYQFEANKEYILVFTMAMEGLTADKQMYICGMTATEVVTNDVHYDFNLKDNPELTYGNGVSFAGKSLNNDNIAGLAACYTNGDLNWKFHSKVAGETGNFTSFMFAGDSHTWDGIRINSKHKNSGAALTIQSPGAGEYKLVLSYKTHKWGAAEGNVYIFENGTDIAKAIEDGAQPLKTVSYFEDKVDPHKDATVTLHTGYTFAADKEYVLVFTMAMEGLTADKQMYICGLTASPVTDDTPDDEDDKDDDQDTKLTYEAGVYDFALEDSEYTYYGANVEKKSLLDVKGVIEGYYTSDEINWKYHSSMEKSKPVMLFGGLGEDTTYKWNGLRIYNKNEDASDTLTQYWNAFTIKSPGEGNYYLTLNYMTQRMGAGQGSVYVLPGDTADIDAALKTATAVATVNFDNRSSSSSVWAVAAEKAFANKIAFEADKEYIVVFTADKAGKAGYSYEYLTKMTLTHESKMDAPEPDPVPQQLNKLKYNFALENTSLKVGDVGFATLSLRSINPPVLDSVSAYYDAEKIDWRYNGCSENGNAILIFGGKAEEKNYAWTGLRMYAKDKEKNEFMNNYYVAFDLRSPGTGKYKVTVDYQLHSTGAKAAELYILPADTTDIPAAIAAGKAIGTLNFDNGAVTSNEVAVDARTTFSGKVAMKAGEEYIAVFNVTAPGRKNAYMYLSALTFTKAGLKTPANIQPERAPEPVTVKLQKDKLKYNFALENTSMKVDGNGFATMSLLSKNPPVLSTAAANYDAGKIYWRYNSSTENANAIMIFGGKAGDKNHLWTGLRMYAKDKDNEFLEKYYIAFDLRSPGTGKYKVTVDYQVHNTGAKAAELYILPAGTTDIPGAIKAGKAIGKLNFDNGAASSSEAAVNARTTFSGNVSMKSGEEYIAVLNMTTPGRRNVYMYLSALTFTKAGVKTPADIIPERVPEPEPIPEGSAIYDLDLSNIKNGNDDTYKKKVTINSATKFIHTNFKKGTINWDYFDHIAADDSGMNFLKYHGFTGYTKQGDWIALKIKSPGKGLHTISLEHSVSGNGGTGAVYVLPSNTQDIEAALDYSNRVGLISYMNEDGTPPAVSGNRSYVGTWEFGSAKEYIIVVEAYKSSQYTETNAYMWNSKIIATPGNKMPAKDTKQTVNSVMVHYGPVLNCEGTLYGTTSMVGGEPLLFEPMEGGKVMVLNLNDKAVVTEIETPFVVPRAMTTDKDGMVWIAGDAPYICRYDPVMDELTTFDSYKSKAPGTTSAFYLMASEDGCLYFGLYGGAARLGCFNPKTEEYTVFGPFNEDATYTCGIVEKDGYIYAGISGDRNGDKVKTHQIVKIDKKTGKMVDKIDIASKMHASALMVRGMGLAGDVLLVGTEGYFADTVVIDLKTHEFIDIGAPGGINYGITGEYNGKVYFVINNQGLFEFDIATRKAQLVDGMKTATIGMRCGVNSIIKLTDPLLPGASIVTYSTGNAIPRVYNLEKHTVVSYPDILGEEYGTPTETRAMIAGLPGSNEIIIGAYNTKNCAVYNVAEGTVTREFEAEASQTDSFVWYDGVLYSGNYNIGCITRINQEDPNRNVILLSLKNTEYKQSRVHTVDAGDDKIFFGTTPDVFEYGGCIGWIDLKTQERYVLRNVVQNQSIQCVKYQNGFLFVTTSTYGGTGSTRDTSLSAKIAIFDVANKTKVGEIDLSKHIAGLKFPIDYIAGIAPDPNEEGKFWGVVSETLFTFRFDYNTKKVTSVREEVSFAKDSYTYGGGKEWFPRTMIFKDGYLYVAFDRYGGLRRISLRNPQDNTRIGKYCPKFYAMGDDGNIYYTISGTLYMYPLVVTNDNRAAAKKVDALIQRLSGRKITLNDETEILAARKAYEDLNFTDRALISDLEPMERAEVDLLELQIDALGKVTLDMYDSIKTLFKTYRAMTKNQQRYVKNYDALRLANREVQALYDANVASEVQKMIDGIKDLEPITLEDEAAIRAIREAYDNLTFAQKQYVDITALLDAEAIIKELRQEIIDKLNKMIASIGEVTLEDEALIEEAAAIFESLYLDEREQVDIVTLSKAQKELKVLQKAAVDNVIQLVSAIGSVTPFSGKTIDAAREAFDALTPGSLKLMPAGVEEYLLNAEATYATIMTITIICVAAVIGGAGVVFGVPSVRKKIFRKKKKEQIEEATADQTEA